MLRLVFDESYNSCTLHFPQIDLSQQIEKKYRIDDSVLVTVCIGLISYFFHSVRLD